MSVHKPVRSKITLTYSFTWQADRCTSRRIAFKAVLNAKARPFASLCSSFLCAYCSKKLPERAPTKKHLRVLSIIDQLRAWAHRRSAYAQLSPLYPSLYPTSLEATESWAGPGNEAMQTVSNQKLDGDKGLERIVLPTGMCF